MITKPPHDRRFTMSTVALTGQRRKKSWMPMLVRASHDIEQHLLQTGFLEDAPFWWVTMIIREGLKDDPEPEIQRINKKYGDLPLRIEIDVRRIAAAPDEKVYATYLRAALIALIHAGKRYHRHVSELEDLLSRIEDTV